MSLKEGDLVLDKSRSVELPITPITPLFKLLGSMSNSGGA